MAADCNCLEFISPCDGTVTYTNCDEIPTTINVTSGQTYNICTVSSFLQTSCKQSITTINLGLCVDGECVTTTTTTFTPTPIEPTNECDVITIFPMEINCITIQPTDADSYDGGTTISITGGTPPYTIIWNDGTVAPAKINLGPGEYPVTIVDYYGDFTAQTVCILTAITTTTTTEVPPTTQKVYGDYCVTLELFSFKGQTTQYQTIQLNYNDIYNGYPSWTSDTPNVLVYWSGSPTNAWVTSGLTNGTIINTSYNNPQTNEPLPLTNWQVLGSTLIKNIVVTPGDCSLIEQPVLNITKNDPTCECNGSISVVGSNGTPPYQYSIDGISFQSTPVFQNLCQGNYTVVIKDNNELTQTETITIAQPQQPVTYTLSLSYPTSTSFVINANPPLPVGASVSFNLSHLSTFIKQPTNSTQTYDNVVTLLKNSVVVPPTGAPTIIPTQLSVLGPCSVAGKLKTETTTEWLTVTMSAGDVITGSFTNNFSILSPQPSCYVSPTTTTQVLITGISGFENCDCCNFEFVNLPNRSSGIAELL